MTFDEESYLGTVTMISPHIALTAGHNLFNDKILLSKIRFIPGVNGNLSDAPNPFGKPKVVAYYVAEDYLNKQDPHEGYGLLILDKPLVDKTGFFDLGIPDEEALLEMTVHITGYPGEKITKKDHYPMYTMGDQLSNYSDQLLYYKSDTSGGQSGSGIWKEHENNNENNLKSRHVVVGVHVRGSEKEHEGIRLTEKVYNRIVLWMEEAKKKRDHVLTISDGLLRLNNLGIQHLANLNFSYFNNLLELDLSHNCIEVLNVSTLTTLRKLKASHNEIDKINLKGLGS